MSPDFDVGTDIARHVGTPTPRSRDQPEPRQRTATAQTALSLFAQLLIAATEPTTVQTLCAAPDPVRLAPNVKQKVFGFYSLDDLSRSVTPPFSAVRAYLFVRSICLRQSAPSRNELPSYWRRGRDHLSHRRQQGRRMGLPRHPRIDHVCPLLQQVTTLVRVLSLVVNAAR